MYLNSLKTALLLASLSSVFFLFGYLIGGSHGVLIAFFLSMALNFFAYFYSDKMVLAMYKAQPLDKEKFAHIHEMVKKLCLQARIPMPKLWYIPTPMANAFATGRNPANASVAVTQGILDILDEHELRGVLAHEISHVKNRDILIGTIAATFATAIGYMADMIRWSFIFGRSSSKDDDRSNGFAVVIASIIIPFAAMLMQFALSRSREYQADQTGAHTCRDPLALASALEKLHSSAKMQNVHPESSAQTSTASLFIVFPFSTNGIINLFSTHPPMEKRVERLRMMAKKR